MPDVLEVLRGLVAAAFGLLALAAWRVRATTRVEGATWFAFAFTALGGPIVLASALRWAGREDAFPWLDRAVVVTVVLFPYLLYRVAATFRARPWPALDAVVSAAMAATLVWSLALPYLPEPGGPQPSGYELYVLLVIGVWVGLSGVVATQLWRAGSGHVGVARRRMRTLAIGTVLLSIALVISGATSSEEQLGFQIIVQTFALLSGAALLLGFAPPSPVRAWWRADAERELHQAATGLLGAARVDDVTSILLPRAQALVGASRIVLRGGTEILGQFGDAEADRPPDIQVDLTLGTVEVWTTRFSPLFGDEERALLERLGLLADLAIDRLNVLELERQARAELEIVNRELESFVYSASHDLKGPLIAILGYIEVLTQEHAASLGTEGAWFLDRMRHNGLYMEALLRDLLELSRVGRADPEPADVDLTALAVEVAAEVRVTHPGCTVDVGDLPLVRMSRTQCRQLLSNLVRNAAVHGGRPDLHVRLSAGPYDGGVLVTIEDDGRGIPEEHRERVFGVFERIAPDGDTSGTGIGLAICRKIVDVAAGRMWIDDSDRGAVFRIWLPGELVRSVEAPRQEVPA